MSMAQLRDVKNFFVRHDKEIDTIVRLAFERLLIVCPAANGMLRAEMQHHRHMFANILRVLIDATRTCYLWPASVQTGQAPLSGLEDIRGWYEEIRVAGLHFGAIRGVLLEALEDSFPDEFSQDMRAAFGFVFDVLAKSIVSAPDRCENSDLLKKFAAGVQQMEPDVTLDHVMGYAGERPEVSLHWQEAAAGML